MKNKMYLISQALCGSSSFLAWLKAKAGSAELCISING
jgi:hypothetical protein